MSAVGQAARITFTFITLADFLHQPQHSSTIMQLPSSFILLSALATAICASPLLASRATAAPACPASNGTTYTSASSTSFTVQCGIDHAYVLRLASQDIGL